MALSGMAFDASRWPQPRGRTLLVTSRLDAPQPRVAFELQNAGVQVVAYTLSTHLASLPVLQEGADLFRRTGASSITVVGNGACIDTAKALRAMLQGGQRISAAALARPSSEATMSIPLVVIPTTLSPVCAYDRFHCLHAEDDVLVAYQTGTNSSAASAASATSTTVVLLDPSVAAASPTFVSPLVSGAYLLSHLLDGLAGAGQEDARVAAVLAVFPFASLRDLLLLLLPTPPASSSAPPAASSSAAATAAGERACLVAAAVAHLRNALAVPCVPGSAACPSAHLFETCTLLALLRDNRISSWPHSWMSVATLGPVLRVVQSSSEVGGVGGGGGSSSGSSSSVDEGGAARRAAWALEAACRGLGMTAAEVQAAADEAGRAVREHRRRFGGRDGAGGAGRGRGDGKGSMGMSVAGLVEGMLSVQAEEDARGASALGGSSGGSSVLGIVAQARRDDEAREALRGAALSPRAAMLGSDFFLDCATAAVEST